jgi:proline iminopeptidase
MDGSPEAPAVAEGFVGSGPTRLFTRALGAGPPVVVLHGGPDFDHQYLLPELDRLAEWCHVVYYDQRGRGRSWSGETPAVTVASEVDDIDRVRAAFGFDTVALIGHSWGGLLAMEYTVRRPANVSRLVLMNTAPASRDDAAVLRTALAGRKTPEQIERMQALAADPAFLAGDPATEAEYYRIHYGLTLRGADHLDAVLGRLRTHFTPAGILAARTIEHQLYEQTWSVDGYDLVPALGRLETPTLVIHGDHDFVPIALVQRIADAMPAATLVVFEECGHFASLEQPERTATTIAAFVAGP